MEQKERLDYLIKAFLAESREFRTLTVPQNETDKRGLLRSLMNIRMPKALPPEVLSVQDDYLQERAREKGIVPLFDIRSVREAYRSEAPYADVFAVWQGDITRLQADAIVNAANSEMLGCFIPMHSCIDNAIHTYAGVQLRAECAEQMATLRNRYGASYAQPTGVPMLTDGYNLPAGKVIHVVGPIVQGQLTRELEKDLADCYWNTLEMCRENDLRSVAFCCISTGVFHFPNRRAAEIAVKTCSRWLGEHEDQMGRIIFNVFKDEDKLIDEKLFE